MLQCSTCGAQIDLEIVSLLGFSIADLRLIRPELAKRDMSVAQLVQYINRLEQK